MYWLVFSRHSHYLPFRTRRDTLRHLCHVWRNRVDLQEAYRDAAERLEQIVGIAQLDLPSTPLREVETFPSIERQLLRDGRR